MPRPKTKPDEQPTITDNQPIRALKHLSNDLRRSSEDNASIGRMAVKNRPPTSLPLNDIRNLSLDRQNSDMPEEIYDEPESPLRSSK